MCPLTGGNTYQSRLREVQHPHPLWPLHSNHFLSESAERTVTEVTVVRMAGEIEVGKEISSHAPNTRCQVTMVPLLMVRPLNDSMEEVSCGEKKPADRSLCTAC